MEREARPTDPTRPGRGSPTREVETSTAYLLPLLSSPLSKKLPSQSHLIPDPPSPRLAFASALGAEGEEEAAGRVAWVGAALMALGVGGLGAWWWAAVGVHLLLAPRTLAQAHASWTDELVYQLQQDMHYKYLLPLLGPVTLFFVTWNWFGLKLFRHNA